MTTAAPSNARSRGFEKIKTGERDLVDMLAYLRTLPQFNGQAAVIGFLLRRALRNSRAEAARLCRRHFLPPRHPVPRLRPGARRCQRAGLHHLGRSRQPGAAEVLDAYRDIPARMQNVEVQIFPGVLHGYMMRGAGQAFDAKTREFSMGRANAILDGLRSGSAPSKLRQAS